MTVSVRIKHDGFEETFTGCPDDVWASITKFFDRVIPAFSVTRRMVLTVDLQEVVDACEGLVAVAEEGPLVLVSKRRLTDGENLLLKLLAAYVGNRLGVLDSERLAKTELQEWLGKSGKITGTRLSELCRNRLVAKEGVCYRLTTFGIRRLVDEVLARIRGKTQTSKDTSCCIETNLEGVRLQ